MNTMYASLPKKILLPFILFLALAGSAFAAGEQWKKDFDKAMEEAKSSDKIVLVEFHGSDWCPPCMKLNKDVLAKDAFKELAEKSLVLVDADFPRKTSLPEAQQEHNDALARKYGVQYFPTVLLIDQDGNVLDKLVGFPRGGLDGFISFIEDGVEKASGEG